MIQYENGNTKVTILNDGTKIREYENTPNIMFPESIDVKITNYCDLGCQYCHESSTIAGKHADLDKLLETLSELPAGVELAIGGGNPLSHPNLTDFLYSLKAKGIIANLTINQGHLKIYLSQVEFFLKEDLVKGLGISITSNNFKYITYLSKFSSNIVFHVITGVNKVSLIGELIKLVPQCKVLVLGYKQYGFGEQYYSVEVQKEIKRWYMHLSQYLHKCVLSFDNLAIEQLNIKRLFTDKGWNMFYMGDDFTYTMYIDAVEQKYAPTSRSKDKQSFNDYTLLNYFKTFKNK